MRTDLQHLEVLFHDRLDHKVLDIFDSKKNSSPVRYQCYEHDSAFLKSNFFKVLIILKDIRMKLTKGNLISHDLEYIQERFGFSDEDMLSVPQNPFKKNVKTRSEIK